MRCTVTLRTSTRCQLKAFYFWKSLLQQVAHNEVSALVRLTFYENLLIGQETSVCFLHEWVSLLSRLNLEKIYRPFPWTNKTVRNNEVSIKADAHKVGCDCTLFLIVFFLLLFHLLFQSTTITIIITKHTCTNRLHT